MSFLEDLIIQSSKFINKQQQQQQQQHLTEQQQHLTEQQHSYLNQLSSLSLDQLKQQPNQLQSINKSLESELSLLCFTQFKNLLINHHTSISIKQSLHLFNHHLHHFILTTDQLDQLSKDLSSSQHSSSLQQILDDRNQIKLILNHLPSFESLLQLPQLISTCIHHQEQHLLWNQAIDLALKIIHLNQINPHPTIGFLQLIHIQVDRNLQSLRDHLLNRLTDSNLKLPLAVRTISTLRRLSSTLSSHPSHSNHHQIIPFQPIHEIELRMSFLISRWKALTENLNQLQLSSGLSSITSPTLILSQQQDSCKLDHSTPLHDDRIKFLAHWIELWRELVGDALSIYLHIFLTTPSSSNSLDSKHHLHPPSNNNKYAPKQFLNDPHTPLNYFLTQALNLLTCVLTDHLHLITSVSSLASLLTQLAYCGTAFGKSGFDFTTSIFPVLLHRLEQLIKLRIQSGLYQLQTDLRPILSPPPTAHSFKRSTGFQIRRKSLNPLSSDPSHFIRLETSLTSSDLIHQVLKLKPEQLQNSQDSEVSMRHWLGFFPPLARFVNSQFTALNELRLLPAVSAYGPISEAQFDSFKTATEYLKKIASVLPPFHPSASPSSLLHEPKFEDDMSEDLEKRSETRFRLVLYRLVLVWTRCILPILERSLRLGIYQELSIVSAESRFMDLLDQCQGLLSSIIPPPTHAEENNGNFEILESGNLSDQVSEPIDDVPKSHLVHQVEIPSVDDQAKESVESKRVGATHSSELDLSKDLTGMNSTAPTTTVQLESENDDDGMGSKNEPVGN